MLLVSLIDGFGVFQAGLLTMVARGCIRIYVAKDEDEVDNQYRDKVIMLHNYKFSEGSKKTILSLQSAHDCNLIQKSLT